MYLYGSIAVAVLFFFIIVLAMLFRTVVSTNDVHIVQSAKRTVSYGKDQAAGNTYYAWPAWVPVIGVKIIHLPVSVFDVDLTDYPGYDKGRVPFMIDIMAFFRIDDSNLAAQRVHSFDELKLQLQGILQGACRSILASSDIEEILEGRAQFGEMFTKAVDNQLKAWGVVDVKNIELMDIRDAKDSMVIANIMAKKKSLIERESRTTVAENRRAAEEAEIVARRQVALAAQEAEQQIGQRTAAKIQAVGVADQEAKKAVGVTEQKTQQAIQDERRTTAEAEMQVVKVNQVRNAEIARDVAMVQAGQDKGATIIKAEGVKQVLITEAEGTLGQAKLHAEGVQIEGMARGEAEKAVLLAPVQAQITLAREIGSNDGYQKYLLGIKEIDKNQVVGVAQAEALKDAEIKVIANSGDVSSGVKGVMDLLTSKGGTQLGAMVEAFAQTPAGAELLAKLGSHISLGHGQ